MIHFLNSTHSLDRHKKNIKTAFNAAQKRAQQQLNLDVGDVVFRDNPQYAITELGVGGYTDALNKIVYISVNSDQNASVKAIESCLDHEFFHLVRHQIVGIPLTLRDRIVDEGLACMYEYEQNKTIPIYASTKPDEKYAHLIQEHLSDTHDTDKWFFGDQNIPKWLGYTLGFNLASNYKDLHHTSAVHMISLNSSNLLTK